jgi:ribosomal protein L37AE/L43A
VYGIILIGFEVNQTRGSSMGQFRCPKCGKQMLRRIIHSGGIVVCENRYLAAMRKLQSDIDAGREGDEFGGHVEAIIPMNPVKEEKYAKCSYCDSCKLIVVRAADRIPSSDIPNVAK